MAYKLKPNYEEDWNKKHSDYIREVEYKNSLRKFKNKVPSRETCDECGIYEYSEIIDYEHCRFCNYFSDNWYKERFECSNLNRDKGEYCFIFDKFRCRARDIAIELDNVQFCRCCGNKQILLVRYKPWFKDTYYIKCPMCETKTRRSWFRSLAFKRWRKLNEI